MSEAAKIPDVVDSGLDVPGMPGQIRLIPSSGAPTAAARWWRIADLGVWGVWIAVVSFTLRYHEKWADEAQAWLIARDLDLKTIWFHELRYEGSPGLWHTILWIAQHVFHARYEALGYIGMAGAAAGVALLIFKAPFPRYIRWPLAFSYFMVYQYAVIARPYTLLPLLTFAAAVLFKDLEHPERITVVLVLLANLSLHGTILAGCLGLVYVMDAYRARKTFDARVRRKFWICIGVMVAVFVFVVLVVKPTPDVEELAVKRELAQLSPDEQARIHLPNLFRKLTTITSGAFLDWFGPSVGFLSLTAAWCFMRCRLLLFVTCVGTMILFYAKIHGAPHHHGTAFVAALTVFWIAWPSAAERRVFGLVETRCLRGITALLLCLCGLNVWDAAIVIYREYLYPYSGAKDAAEYLRSAGADQHPMFGFLMGVAGVQAYFDHNVLSNIPTTYFHHGTPEAGTNLDVDQLRSAAPQYILIYTQDPDLTMRVNIPTLMAEGYAIDHFSDGYYLYKRAVFERETYFILRRVRP